MNNINVINQYQLPNGNWIYHLNAYETDFVYKEIFVNEIYLKHGIKIANNAIVFDIGANIGLFSLYIKEKYPNSKIYAFEPTPEVFKILTANVVGYQNSIKIYQQAVSNKRGLIDFHYYPEFSVISGFYANKKRDTEIIMSGMKVENDEKYSHMQTLITQRLSQLNTCQCQATTISELIKNAEITHIDLIKIDVEGAELQVLQGINEEHWHKINQIVMEVHNKADLKKYLLCCLAKILI